MDKALEVKFQHFLEKFPIIDLPITLSDDLHLTFSQNNEPLNPLMIQQYIAFIEGEEPDEFTEYIPCFKIPETLEFHAIVYWKASLMNYQYVMATFDKVGNMIDKRVLGGTFSDGKVVTKSLVTIDPDWMIYVVTGQLESVDITYDATQSRAFDLELLPDGKIVNSI
ncbi:MAG: hypothetical protein NXI23_08020 [Bacteroidetes bacterium]|jgi:hypothetical protein|nr:hypothetical protein [Bacteroidota bacterium]MDF1867685.1 hypothetical protein [Saprospiraceae bacterium]